MSFFKTFEPYGEEWEKEMMKLTKKDMIAMIKRLQDQEKVKVSKAPLLDVMRSMVGPSYLIRELQATRGRCDMSIKQMSLTGKQIMELAEYAGFIIKPVSKEEDHLEVEITIQQDKEGIKINDEEGKTYNISNCIAYFSEYPEEGCIDLQ